MNKQVKQLDFSGQRIFVGIDAHLRQMTVTILGERLHHKTYSQAPDASILSAYLKRHFPGAEYLAAYEAGFSGFWLQEALRANGIQCIVVNPADVPTKDKERKRKNDKVDSRKIAHSLRNGELEPIYIPDKQCQLDRSLLRYRQSLVKDNTRCRNRIKSLLYYFGIRYPDRFAKSGTHWSQAFMSWLKTVDLGESGNETLRGFILEAEFRRDLLKNTLKNIMELCKHERYAKQVQLLMTVPGVGRLTAITFLAELGDIKRFKNRDVLCNYIGLVPDTSSSDETIHVGNLTKRGNRIIKKYLMESAWIAARKDPALTMRFNDLSSRMHPSKAIVRIGRMLICRILYVLKKEQPYELGVVR